jgi:hypothetical protein
MHWYGILRFTVEKVFHIHPSAKKYLQENLTWTAVNQTSCYRNCTGVTPILEQPLNIWQQPWKWSKWHASELCSAVVWGHAPLQHEHNYLCAICCYAREDVWLNTSQEWQNLISALQLGTEDLTIAFQYTVWHLRFSHRCCWRFSSRMWCCVVRQVVHDIMQDLVPSRQFGTVHPMIQCKIPEDLNFQH